MLGLAVLTVVLSAAVVLWAMIRATDWKPITPFTAILLIPSYLLGLFMITLPQAPLTAGWRIAFALLYAGILIWILIGVCEYLEQSAKKSPQ